jgi:hypothetical protein
MSLKIPRPMMGLSVPGLGKIFVEYSMIEEAKTAKKVIFVKKALGGRTFDNKTVECSFHSEEDYLKNNLEC